MDLKPETMEMLERAGFGTKELAKRAHPSSMRLVLGQDEERIREVVTWLTDGDPGAAYTNETVPRRLLDGLFPGLNKLWQRIRGKEDPDHGA